MTRDFMTVGELIEQLLKEDSSHPVVMALTPDGPKLFILVEPIVIPNQVGRWIELGTLESLQSSPAGLNWLIKQRGWTPEEANALLLRFSTIRPVSQLPTALYTWLCNQPRNEKKSEVPTEPKTPEPKPAEKNAMERLLFTLEVMRDQVIKWELDPEADSIVVAPLRNAISAVQQRMPVEDRGRAGQLLLRLDDGFLKPESGSTREFSGWFNQLLAVLHAGGLLSLIEYRQLLIHVPTSVAAALGAELEPRKKAVSRKAVTHNALEMLRFLVMEWRSNPGDRARFGYSGVFDEVRAAILNHDDRAVPALLSILDALRVRILNDSPAEIVSDNYRELLNELSRCGYIDQSVIESLSIA